MNALEPPVETTPAAGSTRARAMVAGSLLALLVGTHWGTISAMAERWLHDPQYSHGFIVPAFALVVLWSRRAMLKRVRWQPAWAGACLLAGGLALRGIAAQTDFESLDALSLLPTVFGLVLLVGGKSVLAWAWPALAFLAFMMPLPYFVEIALANPLRRAATLMSTYALQTLGCPALAEGNVIRIEDILLGVEQACSGLGMLMTFFALATAVAMVAGASWPERLVLIVSAVPIAVLANVTRITATGLAYYSAGKDSEIAQLIYHDLAGWLMMPLALAMLWLELKFLANLFDYVPERAPLPVALPKRSEFSIRMPKAMAKDAAK